MSTCPACGVAVVPGYVKCPRCGARLPSIRFRRPGETADPGGTAVESGSPFPWVAIVSAIVVAAAIIAFFGLRHRHHATSDDDAPAPLAVGQAVAPPVAAPAPAAPAGFTPTAPAAAPTGPTANQVAADLERALKQQQLWSTVSVVGPRLEIRSSLCGDPQMKPATELAVPAARAAGLTGLRCVEQSGSVAFTRAL